MKDLIENYSDDGPVLERTAVGVVIRSPEPASADQAVRLTRAGDSVWGRVTRSLGNGRLEVQLIQPPDWVSNAEKVEVFAEPPSLPFPWDVGPISASDLALEAPGEGPPWPPSSVAMMKLSGERRALETGYAPVDLLAPIVGGGFNLVIDAHRGRAAFDELVGSAFDAVDIDVRVDDEESSVDARRWLHAAGVVDDYEPVMAAALAWIAQERHSRNEIVAVLELPVVVAEWDVRREGRLGPSTLIADAVASTRNCEVTCVVRLPAATGPDGFTDIVETLALGDVDSQLFIDSKGRFEPTRSSSSAPLSADAQRRRSAAHSVLHQADKASDRLSLWGEDELTEAESSAISRAEAMRVRFANS